MVKTHVEESLGANPADAALNPADQVAMGVPASKAPGFLGSTRGRAFRALSNRPYRLLFASFMVSQIGFWISHLSLQGLMVELSRNDPFWLGLLFFALFLPAFLLAPIAGVAADRVDRKKIMLASYAGVATLAGVLTLLTYGEAITPAGLLGLAFALGTCFSFAGPASFALAANAVPEADLPSAVSLQSAANNLTRVLGPLVAAPVVATSRFEIAFAIYLVAALVSALLIGLMSVEAHEPEVEAGGIFARLRAGFDHARQRRPALAALWMVATLSFFGVSHAALLPIFAEEVLGSLEYFAWIVVATGAGAMLGAISIGYRNRLPSIHVAAWLMCVYGVALFSFSQCTSLWPALITQFVIGWAYFAVMTSLQTLIQQIVQDTMRGRVMSLFQVAWAGLVPWGGLAMGTSGDFLGVTATFAGAAAVCILYGVGTLLWVRARPQNALGVMAGMEAR